MKKSLIVFFFFIASMTQLLHAQMVVGQDTLYGNEWINYSQHYCKILGSKTAKGMIKITYAEMITADTAFRSVDGAQLRMFYMGKEIPIYVSTSGALSSSSFVEFYAKPQPTYIDQFLHRSINTWFSPNYSWVQDASPYFLTWSTPASVAVNPPKRYEVTSNNMTINPWPAKQEYYIAETGSPFYSPFRPNPNNLDYRFFSPGVELAGKAQLGGYESRGFAQNPSFDIAPATDNLITSSIYLQGPPAQLLWRVKLFENRNHDLRVELNGTQRSQYAHYGYELRNDSASIPISDLRASNALSVKGVGASNDYLSLASAILRYPRQFNFENKASYDFTVEPNPNAPAYYEIANFLHNNAAPILYDHTNGQRIETRLENGLVKFVLLPSQSKRSLTLRANNTVTSGYVAAEFLPGSTTVRLFPVKMINYFQASNQGNYIIITNKKLYDDGTGSNWIKAYSAYRKSATGGGYDTLSVEMSGLANQFSYGVDMHPLSIRNFAHFAKKNFIGAKTPKYVFLIGKGYYAHYQRGGYQPLVPGYGFPSSDNALMGSNYTNVPIIPFGRLAAWNGTDVKNYLTKVKEQELALQAPSTQANKAWMKKALHLIGAKDEISIPVYMNNYKNIYEAPSFGGDVYTFQKNSTGPIEQATSRIVDSLINTGVSLINMFGHAYADGTDFNLVPADMQNRGKYPLVLSLGCYSGDMFSPEKVLSERFVLADGRAAIGFIGGVNLNLPPQLDIFATKLYRHICTDFYGKGMGDIMRQVILDDDQNNVVINQNINYHGDPAVRLANAPLPDFVIKEGSLHLTPGQISTLDNDFKVSFTVLNIGKSVADSITLSITRTKPSGISATTKLRVKAPPFAGDYSVTLLTGTDKVFGANTVSVCVDNPNAIPEIDETNNCALLEFQIYSNQLFPVYPPNFGIHPANTVTLKAASTNPLGTKGNYTLEIDTNEDFSAPKRGNIANFSGGLLEWQVDNYPLTDSTVYYWRIKTTGDTLWQNSSFIYLQSEYPGWNQSHYYQYKKDQFTNMQLPIIGQRFKFVDNNIELSLYASHIPNYQNEVFQNGAGLFNMSPCLDTITGGVFIEAINPVTGETFNNQAVAGNTWLHGSMNCNGSVSGWFFATRNANGTGNAAGRDSLERFLTQWIPNGYYVLIWTRGNYKSSEWSNALFQAFENEGATQIRGTMTKKGPYAFFYRKGVPTFANRREISKLATQPIVNEKFIIPGAWDRGSVSSTTIGPAQEWGSFHWRTSATETTDNVSVDVFGVKADKSETLLFSKLNLRNQPLTSVNAQVYPYLKLKWNVKDSLSRTSPHLDYWRVLFKQVPEAVLRPEKYFAFISQPDTAVSRGETVTLDIAVENITATDMDSLRTKYYIYKNGLKVDSVFTKFGKLLGNSRYNTTLTYNTLPLEDRNSPSATCGLYIDVNPEHPQVQHQSELYHFNNTGLAKFYVRQDNKNPLLDVTFDNQHIVNNDVVSSKPEILVTLKDENQYLALNDTSRFKLFLEYPVGTYNGNLIPIRVPVYLNQPNVVFHPANPSELTRNNKAWIRYTPTFDIDGTYTLIVQGKDAADNQSASQNFTVSFRIINKSGISNILNYPNPFTTATQFVFTITGSEVPADLRIQIMTVTGKVVRELTKAELGSIHVGLNRTEFAWDGTDQFGDKLANGIYLYRVTARKITGEDYELINDSENGGNLGQYFQAGFGKMYFMR